MSRATGPAVYNIAAHGGFADGLALGLIDRFGEDPLALARGLVILPNNRAIRTVQEAFVRASGGGLVMPRLVSLGDSELAEEAGILFESPDIPTAVEPMRRRLQIMQFLLAERRAAGDAMPLATAYRLAGEFCTTLDQLHIEERTARDLIDLDVAPELSSHWQDALQLFARLWARWSDWLDEHQLIDVAERRNLLFNNVSRMWKTNPPKHYVLAAGINSAAPAIARLLRTIADIPDGMVLFSNVDLSMSDTGWDRIVLPEPSADPPTRGTQDTHPQFHLKQLLDRMGIARGEIKRWRRISPSAPAAQRSHVLSHAFAVPSQTANWKDLPSKDRSLPDIRIAECETLSDEAQLAALAVRAQLEEPGKRIAVVTPDRGLAERIGRHLKRWGVDADDSAGRPLSQVSEGNFFLQLIETAAEEFAAAALLSLLKHPLAKASYDRLIWLDHVRTLDLLLRGPRLASGFERLNRTVQEAKADRDPPSSEFFKWWHDLGQILQPLNARRLSSTDFIDALILVAGSLSDQQVWRGRNGRQLSEKIGELMVEGQIDGSAEKSEWPAFFGIVLDEEVVRPAFGGHPRVAILGLLEARLQQADYTVCCGLNEGSWPQRQSPDPWLAPMIRKRLNLPSLERQIGLSAHDLMTALGSPKVLLTRAKRDGSGPSVASRFLLRLRALCGDNLRRADDLAKWAVLIDKPDKSIQIEPPAPCPSPEQRKVPISVTAADRLAADPFAFYASSILRLRTLDVIDAEPDAAWRGTAVHDILEGWAEAGDFGVDALLARANDFLDSQNFHPSLRYLWWPRVMQSLEWIASEVEANRQQGRQPLIWEKRGEMDFDGTAVNGRVDRLDRDADGGLVVVDYKTGQPPSNRQVKSGFGLQLGLLGAIAENGGFKDVTGRAGGFEYWSLAKRKDRFGFIDSPCSGRAHVVPAEEMVDQAKKRLGELIADFITGSKPFPAKVQPEYSYADYDHLMRLDEWYGRQLDG